MDEVSSGGIRYANCHIGQVCIALDPHGRVDTIFRKYPLSAKAAYQRWGERLHETKVWQSLKDYPWKEFDFLHIVFPRIEGYDQEHADAMGMPWEAFGISIEDKLMLDEGGYHELPYMYSCYTLNPTEKYGRSPAMLVLAAIKTLQAMERTHPRAGHGVGASIETKAGRRHPAGNQVWIAYDVGLPSSVMRFSMAQASRASTDWALAPRACIRSPKIDLNLKNAFSARPCRW